MNLFKTVYLNIINEANSKFNEKNSILLPAKYIHNTSIKQCLISNHLLYQLRGRNDDFFEDSENYTNIEQTVFKNFELILTELFSNKKYLNIIENNEFSDKPTEFLISTKQFARKH